MCAPVLWIPLVGSSGALVDGVAGRGCTMAPWPLAEATSMRRARGDSRRALCSGCGPVCMHASETRSRWARRIAMEATCFPPGNIPLAWQHHLMLRTGVRTRQVSVPARPPRPSGAPRRRDQLIRVARLFDAQRRARVAMMNTVPHTTTTSPGVASSPAAATPPSTAAPWRYRIRQFLGVLYDPVRICAQLDRPLAATTSMAPPCACGIAVPSPAAPPAPHTDRGLNALSTLRNGAGTAVPPGAPLAAAAVLQQNRTWQPGLCPPNASTARNVAPRNSERSRAKSRAGAAGCRRP